MKRVLLVGFTFALLACGFQPKSETRTQAERIIAAMNDGLTSVKPVAFHSSQRTKASKPVEEAALREASARAIRLMQRAQEGWYKKETCTSCHNQLIPEIPLGLARSRGIAFDEKRASEATEAAFAFFKDLDMAVQGYDFIDVYFNGWSLVAAHAAGIKPSLTTAAYAQLIASHQRADGHWDTIDTRPPQAYGPITATAVCAQAVRLYLPDQLKSEKESRLRQAREWLLKAQPRTTDERAFQLLGLRWTGADDALCMKAARRLLAQQRDDGGWSQLNQMVSDAYSTGEVLYALREGAKLAAGDAAYRRGLRFLLDTQAADGSWHVPSRLHPPAPVSPPFFEAGFPYGHDQFVSLMASSWAVAAMLEAIPASAGAQMKAREMVSLAPSERADWMDAALTGSAADLKRLLDTGMNPNSKTAEGTTALMMAARDLEKVKLLVERGADVNAGAATGVTPLMAAAQYNGNVEVIRLLLNKGARPNPDQGVEVRNNASAIFYAMMAFDVQMVRALADAGANLNARMKVIGRFAATPMLYTVAGGDPAMVAYLISKGANPNEMDPDGISILGWATIINRPQTVKTLLAHGAEVNHKDRFGMTPLLYAASINFGDTEVLDKLIAAGADLKATNKQGQTAADLARTYNHTAMASRLVSPSAAR